MIASRFWSVFVIVYATDAVNVEIGSVSRDHSVDDDDDRNLSMSAPSPNNAKSPFSRCFDSTNAPWTAIAGEDDDDIIPSFQGWEENAFGSPNYHMLSPILIFVTSFDVFQSLKRAEIHAGLSKTPLLDLCWVLDNHFNVYGGVQFLFTLTSKDRIITIKIYCRFQCIVFKTIDGISRSLDLSEWSHDSDFLRTLVLGLLGSHIDFNLFRSYLSRSQTGGQ